jgi:hypothetical protein
MASKVFEQEPDNINHVNFNKIDDHSFLESTLAIVANQVKLGDTNSAVPGRLLGRVEAYKVAGASKYILDTVHLGYKLVFIDGKTPPSSFRENNKSALNKPTFLYEELLRLESLGCTKQVNSRPRIVNPSSVVYSKKWRCVLDASLHYADHHVGLNLGGLLGLPVLANPSLQRDLGLVVAGGLLQDPLTVVPCENSQLFKPETSVWKKLFVTKPQTFLTGKTSAVASSPWSTPSISARSCAPSSTASPTMVSAKALETRVTSSIPPPVASSSRESVLDSGSLPVPPFSR